jgi:hypothetical protein
MSGKRHGISAEAKFANNLQFVFLLIIKSDELLFFDTLRERELNAGGHKEMSSISFVYEPNQMRWGGGGEGFGVSVDEYS